MQRYIRELLFIFLVSFSLNSFGADVITITYGDSYKPFAWGEGAIAKGVQVDFVEEILTKKMGLKVSHHPCPWKRCQKMVELGLKDGFFTVPTPARANYTSKSIVPFYKTFFMMHTSKNNPNLEKLKAIRSIKELESMPDIRHVHMFGSGWHEKALRGMPTVMTVGDSSLIPNYLVRGRADVYIEQSELFRYQVKAKGISDKILTLKEHPIQELGWHIFIGKESKHRTLIPEINKVLMALKASGELDQIKLVLFEKYGI